MFFKGYLATSATQTNRAEITKVPQAYLKVLDVKPRRPMLTAAVSLRLLNSQRSFVSTFFQKTKQNKTYKNLA